MYYKRRFNRVDKDLRIENLRFDYLPVSLTRPGCIVSQDSSSRTGPDP